MPDSAAIRGFDGIDPPTEGSRLRRPLEPVTGSTTRFGAGRREAADGGAHHHAQTHGGRVLLPSIGRRDSRPDYGGATDSGPTLS